MWEDEVQQSTYLTIHSTLSNSVSSFSYVSNRLGASIFVPENRILVQAAQDFGLEIDRLRILQDDDDGDEFGMLILKY